MKSRSIRLFVRKGVYSSEDGRHSFSRYDLNAKGSVRVSTNKRKVIENMASSRKWPYYVVFFGLIRGYDSKIRVTAHLDGGGLAGFVA